MFLEPGCGDTSGAVEDTLKWDALAARAKRADRRIDRPGVDQTAGVIRPCSRELPSRPCAREAARVEQPTGSSSNISHQSLERPTPTLGDMTIQRMDHVSVVVEDLKAAIAFFVELGIELEGEARVEDIEDALARLEAHG